MKLGSMARTFGTSATKQLCEQNDKNGKIDVKTGMTQ